MQLWQIRVLQPNLGTFYVDKSLAAATLSAQRRKRARGTLHPYRKDLQ